MKIHKEGAPIILCAAALAIVLAVLSFLVVADSGGMDRIRDGMDRRTVHHLLFPKPVAAAVAGRRAVYSPADGTIVALEEVEEKEYFKDNRIVVSVFMSIWNVHINWFPVSGTVDYFPAPRAVPGGVAPEIVGRQRTDDDGRGHGRTKIMFRQIAGMVARRIVSYARVGHRVEQNSQCGFIKFGSRVDLFLPLDADIRVKARRQVVGTQTLIARLKKQ